MKFTRLINLSLCLALVGSMSSVYAATRYGTKICNQSDYTCHKVTKGQSWQSLFPNSYQRDLAKRLNRMNISLRPGMVIAIPRNIRSLDLFDISPMPHKIKPHGTKTIIVDQNDLAWGAYDAAGNLVRWGPASGGKSYCPDVGRSCRTATGEFTIYNSRGANCVSSKYPIGRGGAKMPHCMFFHGGYALHGSPQVPGHHASHGCVRIFTEDARWLDTSFIEVGKTKVIVQRL